MKRLSVRGKVGRVLIVALAALVTLAALLPHSAFTLPPQLTRLLTPAPTRPPAPGQFITGAFEAVPLPVVPGAALGDLAPSPRDPATVYVCASSQPAPTGGPDSGAISLWVTHDVGQSWSRVALPDLIGADCAVASALDGSRRLTLTIRNTALNQMMQTCAHSQFFLSDDDGATWRAIQHTALAPAGYSAADCSLWVTARHLFMATSFSSDAVDEHGSAPRRTSLERSDDGGRSWRRADNGLPDGNAGGSAQLLDATGEMLVAFDIRYDNGTAIQPYAWISADAGVNWRRADTVRFPTPPRGSGPIEEFLTEAPFGGLASASQACHCVFGVSDPAGFTPPLVSRDLTQWTPLPPLPINGMSAEGSGVYQILGLTVDGRLVVLGANPEQGVPGSPADTGVSSPSLRLWAWNTHIRRWELALTPVPCLNPQSCAIAFGGIDRDRVSIRLDASGEPARTYLWVIVGVGAGEAGSLVPTWYRLSIPAS
jgi:photosystem II stability/assembly factor-like uncharacterized protein